MATGNKSTAGTKKSATSTKSKSVLNTNTKATSAAQPRTSKNGHVLATKRVSSEERERMIAEAAYYRAERRGFQSGHECQDWLEAEAEVNQRLNA